MRFAHAGDPTGHPSTKNGRRDSGYFPGFKQIGELFGGFESAFHGWKDPVERVAALVESQRLPLAAPEVGEVLTLGAPGTNVQWWKGLK